MTLDFKNTFILDSDVFSRLALKRRFYFAIRLEQIVSAVVLYGRIPESCVPTRMM